VVAGLVVVAVATLAWLAVRPFGGAKVRPGGEAGATALADETGAHIFCVGRVEPVGGEVDVCAQMAGTLESVAVREGQRVDAGAVVALIDAPVEKARLGLAQARLARVVAGFGAEEIAAIAAQREALEAELDFAESELERGRKLKAQQVVSDDMLEARQQRVNTLKKQVAGLQKQYEAMKRGPLPEEIAVARSEVELAAANYQLREVRAPFAGTVLHLYRHTGDGVLLNYPTPILRMADTSRLQVRVEVNEADAYRIQEGTDGAFTVLGMKGNTGRLRVRTMLPAFGPKRLFDPDASVRVDTRTLQVLCDIADARSVVYAGQRVTVHFREIP
jgi:multidrug resistance efflux pump